MGTQHLILRTGEDEIVADGENLSRGALIEQMERLIGSKHFRNSKRYPTFLKFVVEQTLAGNPESLKERTLGVQVFARPSDYDTNTDPIVRVTAGEIRKRLAQYYQEPGHEHEPRIDLPLGSYVPRFLGSGSVTPHVEEASFEQAQAIQEPELTRHAVTEELPPASVPVPPSHVPGARALSGAGPILSAIVLIVVLATLWIAVRPHLFRSGRESIWRSVTSSPNPALIVIGVHSLDGQGREEQIESHTPAASEKPEDMLASMVRQDMVPVSDIVSYSHITDLLTRHSRGYVTVGSSEATFEQLRNGPVVLIGGLDNLWTLRLTSKLRYHFAGGAVSDSVIVDSQQPNSAWHFDNLQRAIVHTRDYAIVASYFDSTIDQPVIIAAGIGKAGTQVAAEFLTNDEALRSYLRERKSSGSSNVEFVLSTEIIDGNAGPARVVASAFW